MTVPLLAFFATAWGPHYGGLNAVNFSLCKSLAASLPQNSIVCFCRSSTAEQRKEALSYNILLLDLPGEAGAPITSSDQDAILGALKHSSIAPSKVSHWIGHDVITGHAAVHLANIHHGSISVVFMHSHFSDYAPQKHRQSHSGTSKRIDQESLFAEADIACAIGPLLLERLQAMRPKQSSFSIIPGLEFPLNLDIVRQPLHAVLYGRFTYSDALVKQYHLSVAALSKAIAFGSQYDNPFLSRALVKVVGVPDEEKSYLAELSYKCAGQRKISLECISYLPDRPALADLLTRSNFSMMLSWREGFGLSGWETISLGIPTIISKNSGLYAFLDEIRAPHVHGIEIKGGFEGDSINEGDLELTTDAIIKVAHNWDKSLEKATQLATFLTSRNYTWSNAAYGFLKGLELIASHNGPIPPPHNSLTAKEAPSVLLALSLEELKRTLNAANAMIASGAYRDAITLLSSLTPNYHQPLFYRREHLFLLATAHLRLNEYSYVQSLVKDLTHNPGESYDLYYVKALGLLNTFYRDTSQYSLAVQVARSMLDVATRWFPELVSSAKRDLARSLAFEGSREEAIQHALSAVELARTREDPEGEAKGLLAVAEVHRHSFGATRTMDEAIRFYSEARVLSGAIGHLDCYLWSLLGMLDCLLLTASLSTAESLLNQIHSYLGKSSAAHPLETLHVRFLSATLELQKGLVTIDYFEGVIQSYAAIGIQWPKKHVEHLRTGRFDIPRPL